MHRHGGVFAGAMLCAAVLSHGQTTDPQYGHNAALVPVIKAYELSASEEAAFSRTDNEPSPFWAAWETTEGSALDQATINGVEYGTWGEATTDPEEGKIRIRLAYGAQGIYILFTAFDDSWSGYTHWLDYANDACELFGCQVSAQDMYNSTTTYLPCLDATGMPHQMNSIYFQLQIRFGLQGLEPVEAFSLNKWNPMAADISIFGCGVNNILYDRDVTFDEALAMGIQVDIVNQAQSTARSQEWLIPWGQWGSTNPPTVSQRARGDRLAMCFGYNDLDPQVQATPTAMRWRKCDPYSSTSRLTDYTGTPTSLDAWGDILFDTRLDDVVPPSAMPVRPASVTRRGAGAGQFAYFSIQGRRITAQSTSAGSAVLRCVTRGDGAIADRSVVRVVR